MRPVALAGILASTTMLGGCAATVGGVTLSSISSFAGFASTLFTGADLGEHAASLFTGKDCRFSEGLMRADRDICETPGSAATRDDFHGIFVDRIDPDGTVIYAAPKYMPASVGAGENENNPDVIWAEIKTQKAHEETERQLARAQTIDVAALATGSLSPQSLAFLPAGTVAESDIVDGDTASVTASRPRPVANAAGKPASHAQVQAPVVESAIDSSQPAIDEKSFTAPIQSAPVRPTGEGGPFIAASTSSAPVVSTLVNGEPVVVLHIGPIFATSAATSAEATNDDVASAEPIVQAMNDPQPAAAPAAVLKPSSAPSPLAVLSLRPPPRAELPTTPASVAIAEPQLTSVRPRLKPAAAPVTPVTPDVAPAVAEVAKPKPAKAARTRLADVHAQPDVYQPPSRTEAAYDPTAEAAGATPVQVPGDIPSEHTAIPVTEFKTAPAPSAEPAPPPATSGPAPLVPMPQP